MKVTHFCGCFSLVLSRVKVEPWFDNQSRAQELRTQCESWADRIAKSSEELLDKNGAWEHYDPETGEGQRDRVKDFGWSWLGYFMEEAHDVL